jgi:hypothetical protein
MVVAVSGLAVGLGLVMPPEPVRRAAGSPAQGTPTPECVSGSITPALTLRLEPAVAHAGQLVTAQIQGHWFGADTATLTLVKPGARSIQHQWRGGRTSQVTMRFLAPRPTGAWQAKATASGEGTVCVAGRFLHGPGGAVSEPITLTVSGAALYSPVNMR